MLNPTLRVKCREIISLVAIHETVLAVQCRGKMKIFSQTSQGYESVAVFDVPEQVSLLGKNFLKNSLTLPYNQN